MPDQVRPPTALVMFAFASALLLAAASSAGATRATHAMRAGAAAATLDGRAAQPVSFLDFRMVTATDGWALTATRVLRTTDGGHTWIDRTPAGLGGRLVEVAVGSGSVPFAFRGSDDAWVAVSSPGRVRIFRTHDAGARWQVAAVRPSSAAGLSASDDAIVLALDFESARDGWLMVSAGGMAAGSEDVELYRTRDAGTKWTLVSAASQQRPSPGGIPAGGIKTGIAFVSPTRGWVTGYRGAQSGFWLYMTEDAGATWRLTALPTPHGYPAAAQFPLTFPPAFIGEDGVLPTLWVRQRATVFYATSDSGAHWRATAPLRSLGGDALRAWSFADQAHGFAATDTSFCVTANGAKSWQCVPQPAALRGVTRLQFLSPRRGWALVHGRLFETMDGGDRWAAA